MYCSFISLPITVSFLSLQVSSLLGNEAHPAFFGSWRVPQVPFMIIIDWWVVLTILKNMKVNGKNYPIDDGK